MNRKQELVTSINRLTKLKNAFAKAERVGRAGRGEQQSYVLKAGEKPVKFNIHLWGVTNPDRVMVPAMPHCNTAACVAGFAGLMPEFRRAGYRTDHVVNSDVLIVRDRKSKSSAEYGFADFFKINIGDAVDICFSENYEGAVTPTKVVKKLNRVICRQKNTLKELEL